MKNVETIDNNIIATYKTILKDENIEQKYLLQNIFGYHILLVLFFYIAFIMMKRSFHHYKLNLSKLK